MNNPVTAHSAGATSDDQEFPARPTLRATRCECRHCQTHTFLVLRSIGDAKCIVCGSYDLAPVKS